MKSNFCFGLFLVIIVVLALSSYIYFSTSQRLEDKYICLVIKEESAWKKNISMGDTCIWLKK